MTKSEKVSLKGFASFTSKDFLISWPFLEKMFHISHTGGCHGQTLVQKSNDAEFLICFLIILSHIMWVIKSNFCCYLSCSVFNGKQIREKKKKEKREKRYHLTSDVCLGWNFFCFFITGNVAFTKINECGFTVLKKNNSSFSLMTALWNSHNLNRVLQVCCQRG